MTDLDLYHLLIQQPVLGTFDGADYIRLDAVWKVPHDGRMPALVGSWQLWPLTTPARVIATERQLCELQAALGARDALIVELKRELEAARRVPPAVAVAATGMDGPTLSEQLEAAMDHATQTLRDTAPTVSLENRAAPPGLDAARIAEPPPEVVPFDLAVELNANDKRRRAHNRPPLPLDDDRPAPTPIADAPRSDRWPCPVCGRDAFARSVAYPDRCLDCAAKLRQAA